MRRRRPILRRAVLGTVGLLLSVGLTPVLAAGSTAVATTTSNCTTSAPVAALPVNTRPGPLKPTVSLTATNSRGLWAGVRYDAGTGFQVVSWQAGRTTVLDTLSYPNVSFDELRSVRVVGVTAAGAVIVSAQATNRWYEAYVRVGLRYQGGHRYVLQSSPLWKSVDPNGVTPDGRVVGLAQSDPASNTTGQVVEWSATGTGAVRVLAPNNARYPVIDGRGDIAYTYTDGTAEFSRAVLADGRRFQLGSQSPDNSDNGIIVSGAGNYLYGQGWAGLLRWNLAAVGAAATGSTVPPSHLSAQLGEIDAAGPNGDLVGVRPNQTSPRFYQDVAGELHQLPVEFVNLKLGQPQRPVAIAADGTVSFTDPTGRVRFFHCSVNPAAHNPRGGLDQAVDIAGTVQLRGAAADPDSTGPIWVEVYDTTGGQRTLLGQVLADQPSPGLDSALRITGNHGFNVVFRTGPGTRSFCVDALNAGPGNVLAVPLGCRTVLEHVGPLG
jgi:hypothetical protein